MIRSSIGYPWKDESENKTKESNHLKWRENNYTQIYLYTEIYLYRDTRRNGDKQRYKETKYS